MFLQKYNEYPENPIFLHESDNTLHTVSRPHLKPTAELFALETLRINSGLQESIRSSYLRSKTAGYLESINSDHLTPNNSRHLQPIESSSQIASTNLLSSTHCNAFNTFNTCNTYLKCKRKLKSKCARNNLNIASEINTINQHNAPGDLYRTDNALSDGRRTGDNMHSSCHKFVR